MAAMYTKMTATGSSLIVAPRTISKELEAKIAAAIAKVVASHDLSKLTTKLVRQFVEKEVHVSLTNHKEVLKRLMHQEFRRIKAEKAAKRPVPQPWKINARRECMVKGLHYVYASLRDRAAPDRALHAMQTLCDLRAVEGFEIAQLASTYARLLAAAWLQQQQQQQHQSQASAWQEGSVPTPQQTLETLAEVCIVERIGVHHPRRPELHDFLDRAPPVYSATDFLGWNPPSSAPVATAGVSAFRQMTDALLKCWYAHSLQLSLGCSIAQILQYLPRFYPYKSPAELSPSDYRDQIHMITTVVMVLTGFGRLRCEPELLPHEFFVLRQHLVHHIVRQDVAMLGEMLRALRCFDGADSLISVRRAMAVIMLSQRADGSWKSISGGGDDDDASGAAANVYHTTLGAVCALTEGRLQGFAPSIPSIHSLLEVHVNADLPAVVVEDERRKKMAQEASVSSSSSATVEPENGGGSSESDSSRSSNSASAGESSSARAGASSSSGAAEESLEEQVRFHQGLLEKAGDNVKNVSAALAQQALATLAGMTLNVDILKSTGVGRAINKLRKHSDEDVAKKATQLVAKWKKDLL